MAISYLHHPNHLLVQVVPRERTDKDELFTYGGLRARFDMTGAELKEDALKMWSLEEGEQNYKLVRIVPSGEIGVNEGQTLAEMGITNGAPIQIVEI